MRLSSFAVFSLPFLLMLLFLGFVGKSVCLLLRFDDKGIWLEFAYKSGTFWTFIGNAHGLSLSLFFFFSTETRNPSKLDEGQVLENLSVGLLDHTVLLRDINVPAIRSFPP